MGEGYEEDGGATIDDLVAMYRCVREAMSERYLLLDRLHALAEKCDRLDGRRHELHDLLTTVEAERDLLQSDLNRERVVKRVNDAAALEVVMDRNRLRAALTMIAIPPSNPTRDDHPLDACAGCARLAQLALDGHDFRPNVDRLDESAEDTDE